MPFELQIALRYLLAKRRQVFISVISLVSTIGVTVGVMALIIALALMTGLQNELRDRILGSSAHVYVWKPSGLVDYRAEVAKMKEIPGVAGAAPAILGKALVTSDRGEGFITVKGIDPELESAVTDIGKSMTAGDVTDLKPATDDDFAGILIGKALSGSLSSFPGDVITLVTPQGSLSPMGLMPRQRRVRIAGTFSLGLFEFDQSYGFVDLADGLPAHRAGPTGPPRDSRHRHLQRAGGGGRDSGAARPRLHHAGLVRHEPVALFGAVAREDRHGHRHRPDRDGGRPQHRGLAGAAGDGEDARHRHPEDDGRLVTQHHADLPGAGHDHRPGRAPSLGATLGAVISYLLDRYRVISIPSDVYQVTYLPFKLLPWDLAVVVMGAVVVCFVATLYPSRQAARLDPAQALRYE